MYIRYVFMYVCVAMYARTYVMCTRVFCTYVCVIYVCYAMYICLYVKGCMYQCTLCM